MIFLNYCIIYEAFLLPPHHDQICTLKKTILTVEDIIALIGDKCDGVIGQVFHLLFDIVLCAFLSLAVGLIKPGTYPIYLTGMQSLYI